MPYLGDIFLNTVYAEDVGGSAKATEHAVEQGVNITDHVKPDPESMNISGIITGPDSSMRRKKLRQYKDQGKLLKYSYRNILTNVIITDLKSTHDATVKGGLKFSMTLKEVRIAKPATTAKVDDKNKPKVAETGNKGLQQPKGSTPAKIHVVKSGDTLSKIGQQYNVNWKKIYDKNKGVIGNDYNKIYAGQKLVIPA